MGARLTKFSLGAGLVCATLAALGATERELQKPHNLRESRYVQAAQCARCHPDHAASFGRTFHRTMTQAANEVSVRGDFANASLDYFGVGAHMSRESGGEFVISYQLPGSVAPERFVVEKTIGSRRYQQYVARRGSELVRLPVAYHLEERRWFHMNGAFLTPDPELASDGALAREDYERHVTRWNDNCIFCHNVAANPGLGGSAAAVHYNSEVAELGIACEACHGPGSEHAQRNASPLRRYLLHASERSDPTIVHPSRLSPARSLDLCGRCHGQRMTDDVERFLRRGDPFIPGEDLALYSAPLWRDTTLHGEHAFEARFWRDGTPRLTAYEYQGTLLSPCAARGPLTCLSCHAMHEGDPRGQLRPDRAGAALCTQCHDELDDAAAQASHARHAAGATLPSCTDCHMPKVVYGVLDVHPSHRIELPNPAAQANAERPDACTLCHSDRTRSWARGAYARMFGSDAARGHGGEEPTALFGEVESQLFAGDPIERVLSAAALSAPMRGERERRRLALLLEAAASDRYPAVRHLALRAAGSGLAAGERATLPAPELPAAARQRALATLRARFSLSPEQRSAIAVLRTQAEAHAIEIGE